MTKQTTDRRELHFSSMADILENVEYLAAGDPPRSTGNWTPAQIVEHVGRVIDYSIEGFPTPKAAMPVRFIAWLLRRIVLARPMQPGIKLPGRFANLLPDHGTIWDDAVDRFRAVYAKLATRQMTQPSPVFGRLSHQQWEQLHCRHAEMHFSFMHPA